MRRLLVGAAVVMLAPVMAHLAIGPLTRIEPPTQDTPRFTMQERDDVRRAQRGWSAVRGVRLVYLAGTPEEIGAQHTALLYDRMAEDERVLWDGFAELVPLSPARTLLFDIGRVQHRHVSDNFPAERRREIGAQANAFVPDPYASLLPTYQRMITLHALYDIALGFERSPLLACTAFGIAPPQSADGHAFFARAFDFEAAEVFDQDKVVFIVEEQGAIPFASVAWPGFIGVVTGMNEEGVAVAVHGARARETSTTGMPVPFSLRNVLSKARTAEEAIALLKSEDVMVSHIVYVGDASGRFVVVERAPGVPAFVRPSSAITNHFEGPLAGDPKDDEVRKTTTTLERRARIDQLLAKVDPASATKESVLAMLRDHECAAEPCPAGDRRSIDAFIATHGVIADLTARELWVSEGPRLSGKFVKVKLRGERNDAPPADVEELPADPALTDGRYTEGRARAGGPLLGAKKGAAQ
ncbi:MAG: hypothetical protein KIT84_31325 [Labilithrix sp.]|nr:hypothetical protein [Labilithrix sp.]MCW5815561.1 hypothetical protein [Labilithrix sp.]